MSNVNFWQIADKELLDFLNMKREIKRKKKEIKIRKQDNSPGYSSQVNQML